MVNQDILGGLRLAVGKGESLKKAMFTFYNAGYRSEEIEEAAKVLQRERISTPKFLPTASQNRKLNKKTLPSLMKGSHQKISTYNNPKKLNKKISKFFIISFILVALIFVGLLIAFLLST